ncbi:transcriptional regulator SplA domain-containing protein [Bacillus sp. 31A1R]|uniref:Transcriptional regulator SplA domain-containing protein n=1 Tax=Robertmurraya mangrovi TaxID=3098077 RepID=A0ABU5J339_9BACI|nr:transcriptional regulator SplA domain-containing protein [Bacillus sp. 31A1R]MDZ5473834.1 transcriptional regulator SplA domain-containing protein [Bacillus sp. 31A1R]
METIDPKNVKPGDEVYVIYNNPHTPTVSNIRAAEIVPHPKDPNQLALFLNETFHVIEDDDALFTSENAAEQAFNDLYGDYNMQ